MVEKIRHNCGFCLAYTLHDVYSFIKALQHRGREAAGIAFIGEGRIDVLKWVGNVERFDIEDLYKIFPSNKYHTYLAHVRYATRGRKDKILQDAHPHVIGGKEFNYGSHKIILDCDAVIVHNGQVNPEFLGEINSVPCLSDCDSEKVLKFFEKYGEEKMVRDIPGAYSLAIASKKREEVMVIRDKTGMKPACLGWKDGKYAVSSEDISFEKNGARFIRNLEPGTVYYFSKGGEFRKHKVCEPKKHHCFFEYNYISHVESSLDGIHVRKLRKELGKQLAKEFSFEDVDFVTFLPRCPEVAARRYSEIVEKDFLNIFYKMNSERSFLGSDSEDRCKSITSNLCLMPVINNLPSQEFLKGKKIVLIDDSTIRGNNSLAAIKLLKQAGVEKIYLLNYTPKIGIMGHDGIGRGCEYGVDMPPTDNFVSRNNSDEQINEKIGAEVKFLSVEGMLECFERLGIKKENLCYYCIGGERPF